jgi:hypothetical protein
MDAEIGARLEAARRRMEQVVRWMDRQTLLAAERVQVLVEGLERLERDRRADLLRLHRALRSP